MKRDDSLPVLAFSLGDPGGIGPELVLRTIDYFSSGFPFIPVIFGSYSVLEHPFLKACFHHRKLVEYSDSLPLEPNNIYFKQCCALADFDIKKPSSANGFAAHSYIKTAVQSITNGQCDALVTAPICKESLQLADIPFTGHTTLLKSLSAVDDVSMAFHTSKMNVVLATIHVPLKDVPGLITQELLRQKIDHAVLLMKKCGKEVVNVAVAGLNPHAGENGVLGTEEHDILMPAIESFAKQKDVNVKGPFPADTLFYRAYHGEFDVVIALYHDQGLIPVKLFGFHEAVNITLGLPFVRTSPDYGTAFDRAYTQSCTIDSMVAATHMAMRLI